jgi:hypothetical protein
MGHAGGGDISAQRAQHSVAHRGANIFKQGINCASARVGPKQSRLQDWQELPNGIALAATLSI